MDARMLMDAWSDRCSPSTTMAILTMHGFAQGGLGAITSVDPSEWLRLVSAVLRDSGGIVHSWPASSSELKSSQVAQLRQNADKDLPAAAGDYVLGVQCCQMRQPAPDLHCNALLLMHDLLLFHTRSMQQSILS
jgi:hypothetical protein